MAWIIQVIGALEEENMAAQQPTPDELARTFARTASQAYKDQAEYFRALPDDAWSGPTGCEKWTMHDLAGHIVGEAVWFANLVRTVTEGAPPLPDNLWGQLKRLPGKEITDRMTEAADSLVPAADRATSEQLRQTVDLGFMKMPLWQAFYVNMLEAVYHNWDGRARREPGATIPIEWAQQLATLSTEFAPVLAHRDATREVVARYLLLVGDGVGAVTVMVDDGSVDVEHGQAGTPDVTLHLTADQYGRLLAGRCPLDSAMERDDVTVEGNRSSALDLNRIFRGV